MISQGEKLLLLVKRDTRSADEVAADIGVTRTYLPKLYKRKELPAKIIQSASRVYNVDPSYFLVGEDPAKYGVSILPDPPDKEELDQRAEVLRLNQRIAELESRLDREVGLSDDLRQLIKSLTSK